MHARKNSSLNHPATINVGDLVRPRYDDNETLEWYQVEKTTVGMVIMKEESCFWERDKLSEHVDVYIGNRVVNFDFSDVALLDERTDDQG
jgi:hypothetical protein